MQKRPYRYISFLIPTELEQALKKEAIKQERSVAWIIRKSLEAYLGVSSSEPKKPSSR